MTIESIEINNFRSIETLSIKTSIIDEKVCSILLGKNESGKSTILRAIGLLDKERPYNYEFDCNKNAKKNAEDIIIIFKLNFDYKFYKEQFLKQGVPDELIKIEKIERRINIKADTTRNDYFYVYLVESEAFSEYVISSTDIIEKVVDVYDGGETLTKDNITTLLPYYKICNKHSVESIIEKNCEAIFEMNTPNVIFWEPSSQYLINEPINLLTFKDNTPLSIPLRNIFHIANIRNKDIKTRIELIEGDNEERMELSETLSEEITKYINEVWVEHRININITIDQNLQCIVNVEDKDNHRPKFKMEQRSDGFKQFISILLNLSAENKTSILKNKLILLDEPEVHLHPSGIRYLRDELLKISENNNLLIATHSTYMIDKMNLNRHFSVIKNKSLTEINQISENNPYEEEVLYESLGTSIFEFISPTMLIFEGKTDVDLFNAFSYQFRNELSIKNISAISANGVDKIPNYVKFFSGELVKGFVIVDSDNIGKSTKKIVIKDNDNFTNNNTFEISDLLSTVTKNMTLEDMIPKNIIEGILLDYFEITFDLNNDEPFIFQIKNKHKKINEKELKMNIIDSVITDINKKAMTKEKVKEKYPVYYEFISSLYNQVHS